jgi:hypothetical protein
MVAPPFADIPKYTACVSRASNRAICAAALIAVAALAWPALAAAAAPSEGHVNFGQAKSQLKRYAVMVCPYGTCPSRIYGCKRRSARRVDCKSQTLINNEAIPVENESEAQPNEICSWLGIATPSQGSGSSLRIRAEHFRCHPTKSRHLPPL